MKYPVAAQETLERLVIAESDSLESAIEYVQAAYRAGKIVFSAMGMVPVQDTGDNAEFREAEYVNKYDLPGIKAETFDI